MNLSLASPFGATPSARTAAYGPERVSDDLVVSALDASNFIRARMHTDDGGTGVPAPITGQLRDADGIDQFIDRAWAVVTRQLTEPTSGRPAATVPDLLAALTRLRALQTALATNRRDNLNQLSDTASEGLRRLGHCTTPEQLFSAIPAQASRLGFDRVLFSSVDAGRWVPRSIHSRRELSLAQSMIGREAHTGFTLPSAANHPHPAHVSACVMQAHRDRESGFSLWQRSKSKSFWMIPVVYHHRIVGILHADCHFQDRLASRPEVEALQRFSAQLAMIISSMGDVAPKASTPPTIARPTPDAPQNVRKVALLRSACTEERTADPDFESNLSQREMDVVALMAEGLTNAQIGRRLSITEGTVKSHVKRILRKTSSSNRAEAVAIWMNTQRLPAV